MRAMPRSARALSMKACPRIETLESRFMLAADVVINEFMAANQRTIEDGYGASSDWIELLNQGDAAADLSQMFLTDDPDNLTKWGFPDGSSLDPGEYQLIYASGFNAPDKDGKLHTNFNLSASGNYLALTTSNLEVLSEYGADGKDYPDQFADISYGIQEGTLPPTASDVPQTISKTAISTITSTIEVAQAGQLSDVNVTVDITHSWNDDLDVWLISPQGTRVELFTDVGGSSDNFRDTTLDDQAANAITSGTAPFTGAFQPEGSLATLNGELAAGTWTLEISDDFTVEGGSLNSWSLELSAEGDNSPTNGGLVGFLLQPTPGEANPGEVANVGPTIEDVTDRPGLIPADQALVITAKISPRYAEVASTELVYRVMYGEEITTPLRDDGKGGDETANDGVFTATVPVQIASPGDMIRWRVVAQDGENRVSRAPAFLDTDGENQSPEYYGTVVSDPNVDSPLNILHWYLEPGTERRADTSTGTRASVYYGDEFYDNVFVRLRGGSSTGLPKKSYKIDFNTANDFRFAEDAGRVQEINLNTTYTNKDYIRQALAYETYDAAGLPASEAFPVRVQRNSDFFSVAMLIEQPDADMLEREGLDPDGALYKMYNKFTSASGGRKRTREYESNSDLGEFIQKINQSAGEELRNYVFDNVNVPAVLNYLAATVIMQNNDQMAKNYFLYRDSEGSGEWMFLPWDLDLVFGLHYMSNDNILDDTIWADKDNFRTFAGVTIWPSHPFVGDEEHPANRSWNQLIDALYEVPEFREMYLRRLRSLMDDLLQHPETPAEQLKFEARLDAYQELLAADVALDYARWADPWRWGDNESFSESLQRLKDEYLAVRRRHLYETHSVDNLNPEEVKVLVPQFTDARYFVPSDDSLGNGWTSNDFDDATWSVGSTGLGFENTPRSYQELIRTRIKPTEVAADSTSLFIRIPFVVDDLSEIEDLTLRMKYDDGYVAYLNGVEVSRANLRADGPQSYNSRARSRPTRSAVEFEDVVISQHVDQVQQGKNVLAIHLINSSVTNSDLMVVPELVEGIIPSGDIAGIPHAQPTDVSLNIAAVEFNPTSGNQAEEYLAIQNPNDFAVDVSGWKIAGAVEAELVPGTVIRANEQLYLSPDVRVFRSRATGPSGNQGLLVQPYEGRLSNAGGTLRLLDPENREIDSYSYVGTEAHPQQALRISEINYNPHAALTQFSELDSDNDSFEFIEIRNTGATTIDLSGARLIETEINDDNQGISFEFTHGQLEAGGQIVLAKNLAAFQSRYGTEIQVSGEFQGKLSNGGETLTFVNAIGEPIQEFRYNDGAAWPALADGGGAALEVIDLNGNYDDPENWRASLTIGGTPGASQVGFDRSVVINEILTRTTAPSIDKLELYNASESAIDLAGWYISDGNNLTKFTISDPAVLGAGEFRVFDESQLGFGFKGDTNDDARLIRADAQGRPVAFADYIEFGPAEVNQSFGRVPDGVGDLQVLQTRSFGSTNGGPIQRGDLNGDLAITDMDIDLLCDGIRTQQPVEGGDLNLDGILNELDVNVLVKDILKTTVGDANLDRIFNSSDLVAVFIAGQYEDAVVGNSGWATGDWNCDAEFNSSDLVVAFREGAYADAALTRLTQPIVAAVHPHHAWPTNQFLEPEDERWRRLSNTQELTPQQAPEVVDAVFQETESDDDRRYRFVDDERENHAQENFSDDGYLGDLLGDLERHRLL